jgi:hypothetical protein
MQVSKKQKTFHNGGGDSEEADLSNNNNGDGGGWASMPFIPARQRALQYLCQSSPRQEAQGEPDDNDDGGDQTNPDQDVEEIIPEIFEPRPLKSRKRERDLFGDPGDRSTCWGCVHAGEKDVTISVEAVKQLVEMARTAFGRVDLIALAQAMENYHETKIRQVFNVNLPPGKKPIPPWKAAQILEHLRDHNQDPLVQLVVMLSETQELRGETLNHCFEVSNKGKVRPNKNAIDAYDKLVKLQIFLQKQDPSKMAFTSAGARVDPTILNQGVISFHGKKLRSHWQKK